MENISTSLIISTAIMIAVLLISISVFVLNMSKDSRDEAEKKVKSAELITFNDQFEIYEGDVVNASKVKALIGLVKANNSEHNFNEKTDLGTDKYIKIVGVTSVQDVSANSNYSVHVTEYTKNGYISVVTIKEE